MSRGSKSKAALATVRRYSKRRRIKHFDDGGDASGPADGGFSGSGDPAAEGLGGLSMGTGASIGDSADAGAMGVTGETGVGGIGADPSSGSGSASAIAGGDSISGNATFGGQLADQGSGGIIGGGIVSGFSPTATYGGDTAHGPMGAWGDSPAGLTGFGFSPSNVGFAQGTIGTGNVEGVPGTGGNIGAGSALASALSAVNAGALNPYGGGFPAVPGTNPGVDPSLTGDANIAGTGLNTGINQGIDFAGMTGFGQAGSGPGPGGVNATSPGGVNPGSVDPAALGLDAGLAGQAALAALGANATAAAQNAHEAGQHGADPNLTGDANIAGQGVTTGPSIGSLNSGIGHALSGMIGGLAHSAFDPNAVITGDFNTTTSQNGDDGTQPGENQTAVPNPNVATPNVDTTTTSAPAPALSSPSAPTSNFDSGLSIANVAAMTGIPAMDIMAALDRAGSNESAQRYILGNILLQAGQNQQSWQPYYGVAAKGGRINTALHVAKRYARGGKVEHEPQDHEFRDFARGGLIDSPVPGRTDKLALKVKSGTYIIPADIVSGLGEGNTKAGTAALDRLFRLGPYGAESRRVATPNVNYGHPLRPITHMHRAVGGRAKAEKALPADHELGMVVPKGGSMCANCRFLKSPTTCGNEKFIQWNGSPKLPAPADKYCCDLYEKHPRRADGGGTPMDGPSAPLNIRSDAQMQGEANPDPVKIIAAGGEYSVPPEVVKNLGGGDMNHGHDILDHFVLHKRKELIGELKKLKPPKRD